MPGVHQFVLIGVALQRPGQAHQVGIGFFAPGLPHVGQRLGPVLRERQRGGAASSHWRSVGVSSAGCAAVGADRANASLSASAHLILCLPMPD
jgi:hypothetical protein